MDLEGIELDVDVGGVTWYMEKENLALLREEDESLWLAGRKNNMEREQSSKRIFNSDRSEPDWFLRGRSS